VQNGNGRATLLLNGAGHLRENSVRVGTNKTDGADHDYKNDREHDSVFRDVLSLVIKP
jgi:hypothetical protein